ncbi:HET-domain-containing protein [Stipitochalara longipes BDJ]|nr:HET-domain-containing protein [Stipitochalara longipes BDJ]
MRLINVKTFEFREFFGADVPHYAILSHRWEDEEVTFQDIMNGKGRKMIGWKKIEGVAWVDSCCIDKTSSAELSEAINSMLRWYRDAEICYAYLSDVKWRVGWGRDFVNDISAFRESMWFTRGWTLQELFAPDEMIFFDRDWIEIGTKESMREIISQVTGIKHLFNFEEASVAQKMSWAAKRVTTRLEDQAYCLLGIFGVNMPPLYGEGLGAFVRLQLEIMKTSSDESLFAWEDSSVESSGMLALSPASFRYASDIVSMSQPWIERPPYSMTNKGLEISLYLREWTDLYCFAPLNCVRQHASPPTFPLSVVLSKPSAGGNGYQRKLCDTLMPCKWADLEVAAAITERMLEKIWIQQPQIISSTRPYCYFRIKSLNLSRPQWEIKKRLLLNPELGRWGLDATNLTRLKLSNTSAAVVLYRVGLSMFMLKVSCVGRVAYAALLRVEAFGDSYYKSDVLGHLRDNRIVNNDNIITNEVKTFRKLVGGIDLKASVWKKGGSGSREIFTIHLEHVR